MMRALLLLLTAVLIGCRTSEEAPRQASPVIIGAEPAMITRLDRPAPDVEAPMLSGDVFRLDALVGHVVIVNFWATWCAPCVRETPALVALQREWADRPFTIVGISEDMEGPEIVQGFVDRYEIPYPIVLDDGSVDDAFGGVYAMPSTYIVDASGQLVHRVIGEFPFEEMRPELERLLEEADQTAVGRK